MHPVRRTPSAGKAALLIAALAAPIVVVGCQRGGDASVRAGTMRPADLRQLVFGRTTGDDVEHLFGVPDERATDGALTYRAALASRQGRSRAETFTFRFTNGVLSRICRSRS
ncbi:MAG TPA: hypothetical protein VLI07_13775 [Candidatus Binatus sp.]|nr:hypothetical protein [Candidatus Binatus sp.]